MLYQIVHIFSKYCNLLIIMMSISGVYISPLLHVTLDPLFFRVIETPTKCARWLASDKPQRKKSSFKSKPFSLVGFSLTAEKG
jgi:hypothetical protein